MQEFLSTMLRSLFDVTVDDFVSCLASCCENVVVTAIVQQAFTPRPNEITPLSPYADVQYWADRVIAAAADVVGQRRVLSKLLALNSQGMSVAWLAQSALDHDEDDGDDGGVEQYDDDDDFDDGGSDADELELGVVVPDQLVGSYGWAEPLPHPTAFDRNTSALFRLVLVPSAGRVDFEPSIAEVGVVLSGGVLVWMLWSRGTWVFACIVEAIYPTTKSSPRVHRFLVLGMSSDCVVVNASNFVLSRSLPRSLSLSFARIFVQVERTLLGTLEDVARRVSSFTSPEHQLLRLLHLSPRPLLPLRAANGSDPVPSVSSAVCDSSVARLDAARCVCAALLPFTTARHTHAMASHTPHASMYLQWQIRCACSGS